MNKKITIGVVALLMVSSIAGAQTLSSSEFAVRQQMIDFAKFFPNLVSQFYPDTPQVSSPILGGFNSVDFPSPYIGFGGIKLWAYKVTIPTTLATTSCSIPAPFATSTVLSAAYSVSTISSTSLMTIGWSSGPMATTTRLSPTGVQMDAGNPQPVTASTTVQSFVVPPSTRSSLDQQPIGSYINFKIANGAVQTAAPTGTCSVIFRQFD